jgi:predicted ATPase
VGRKGENYVDAIMAARERGDTISQGKGKKRTFIEEYIAEWLRKMNMIHSFLIEEIKPGAGIYQVKVQRTEKSSPVLITDVGFGVSQLLPVITLCFYAPEGSTLLIEQPEIHLHPMAQMALADVFIDAIKKRNIQIIIESHSEYLL